MMILDSSGAGTNLKVGGHRSAAKVKATDPAQSARNFFGVVPLHFLALKAQLVVFGERFRDGQCSLVSFLFAVLLLTLPPVPSHL